MSRSGHFRAVLDRVEEGVGVVLIESDGEVVDEESVDLDDLAAGVEAGAVLQATYDDGALRRLVFDPEETARRRSELQDRFDRLAERSPGPDTEDDGAGEPEG